MGFQLRKLLLKVIDLRSISQTIGRFFWPTLSITLLLVYLVCYNHEERDHLRRFKQEAEANPSAATKRYWNVEKHSTSQNVRELIIGNIVYPQVDTSNFPTIDEDECPSMMEDIELAPAYSMPFTALASFPRSGNTWSRNLLQVATKYYTGSVYWETEGQNEVLRKVFKGGTENYNLRKGVCIKTHFFEEEHIALFEDGAILLVRNPHYSLVSEFMRIYSRLRNVSKPEIIRFLRENDERWPKEFHRELKNWRSTILNWINYCKRLMIVFYEDLAENPVRELTRMVAFLGQPIQPKRIQCAVYNYKPIDSSQHKSQMDFDPYTTEMHKMLDGFIAEVNETLIQKNAIPLPTYKKYYLSGK